MTVLSFRHWVDEGRLVVMDNPCDRPYHNKDYIWFGKGIAVCERCCVNVEIVTHELTEDWDYYG